MSDTDTGDDGVVYWTAPASGFDCGHVCCPLRPSGDVHGHRLVPEGCPKCVDATEAIRAPGLHRQVSDPEGLPTLDEFAAKYFPPDRPPTMWQLALASDIIRAIAKADDAARGHTGHALDRDAFILGPQFRPPCGRSTALAAIVAMMRDTDKGVRLLFTSRSEATAQRRVEDMRAAVEELAPAMLGRMRGTPVAAPSQPVLSAGDAARIVGLGQELAQYRKQAGVLPYDQPEGELLTWLERFLYPDMYVTGLPVATDHHPSSGCS